LVDAFAASSAEVVACSIRVPTELIKQRAQARPACGVRVVVLQLHRDAGFSGFYRGYASTVRGGMGKSR
jgi:solute carrier family 25 S-adenosylmethionine transporter 26